MPDLPQSRGSIAAGGKYDLIVGTKLCVTHEFFMASKDCDALEILEIPHPCCLIPAGRHQKFRVMTKHYAIKHSGPDNELGRWVVRFGVPNNHFAVITCGCDPLPIRAENSVIDLIGVPT